LRISHEDHQQRDLIHIKPVIPAQAGTQLDAGGVKQSAEQHQYEVFSSPESPEMQVSTFKRFLARPVKHWVPACAGMTVGR
jgi:hypothetical protein